MSVKISGCIVTHNSLPGIEQTIDSLLNSDCADNFELFIVDNLSTDGTPDYLREKYPSLEIIEPKTNNGFSAGHNVVLPLIDSEYHAIINPDVLIDPDVLSKMVEYMDAHPDIGLLSPRICFPDGRMQILGKRDPELKYLVASRLRNDSEPSATLRKYAMLDEDMSVPVDIENASGCFMLVRTELFRELGGFDEGYFMYFEDCDLSRRIRQKARVVYFPDATVYHVWGRESKKNVKLMLIQIKSMFRYFRKWGF